MLVLVTVLFVFSLAACSNNDKDNAQNVNEVANNEANGDQNSPEFNETGFPIANDQITLKIFARRDPPNGSYEDMLMFKEYEKMTNINVEWEDVPSEGFAERKNLLFASNELPDVLYKSGITPLEAVRYGSNGMLIPLEDLIDKNAPNIKQILEQYPEILSAITAPDGHIYAFPAIMDLEAARTNKFWVNKSWLANMNLEVPNTTEQLIDVLRAFKENDANGNGDPKDEVPMTQRDWPSLLNSMSGSFGLLNQMGYQINIENDKVDIWMTDDSYKQYLMFLNQLYTEGLLDNTIFTQKPSEFVGKMASGIAGTFHNQASDPFAKQKENYMGIAPVAGPDGDQLTNASPIARDFGTFAITSNNQHPEATIRWLDYFFSEEGSILFRYGIEGETFNYKADGAPEYTDEVLNDKRGSGVTIGQFTPWPGGGSPQYVTLKNASAINPPEVQEAQDKLTPYMPKAVYGAPLFDEKTAKEVDTLRQDIDTYFKESSAKFITGSIGFDKWEQYVSTLESMNLDQLEKLYQEAYDLTK